MTEFLRLQGGLLVEDFSQWCHEYRHVFMTGQHAYIIIADRKRQLAYLDPRQPKAPDAGTETVQYSLLFGPNFKGG